MDLHQTAQLHGVRRIGPFPGLRGRTAATDGALRVHQRGQGGRQQTGRNGGCSGLLLPGHRRRHDLVGACDRTRRRHDLLGLAGRHHCGRRDMRCLDSPVISCHLHIEGGLPLCLQQLLLQALCKETESRPLQEL